LVALAEAAGREQGAAEFAIKRKASNFEGGSELPGEDGAVFDALAGGESAFRSRTSRMAAGASGPSSSSSKIFFLSFRFQERASSRNALVRLNRVMRSSLTAGRG
jgi:hypothetical protein